MMTDGSHAGSSTGCRGCGGWIFFTAATSLLMSGSSAGDGQLKTVDQALQMTER